MVGQPRGGHDLTAIGGQAHRRDLRTVTEGAVGDHAHDAASHHPGQEHVAHGGGARVVTAVDHHHLPRPRLLHRHPLQVAGVRAWGQGRVGLLVLPRGDHAHRVGLAREGGQVRVQRLEPDEEALLEAEPEELRRDRAGGAAREARQLVGGDGDVAFGAHGPGLLSRPQTCGALHGPVNRHRLAGTGGPCAASHITVQGRMMHRHRPSKRRRRPGGRREGCPLQGPAAGRAGPCGRGMVRASLPP